MYRAPSIGTSRTQDAAGTDAVAQSLGPSTAGAASAPRMARQNTNQRRQAMSDIEASVTKLLIATKQLLECLTQWSKLQATEKDVSDIYVNLGNEFNRATVSFQNAGIDMSDLESTPGDLRNILERALGEDASAANLDRFLPRIREIIINLLQGLKRKQQIHRVQNGEAAAPSRMRRSGSQGTHHSGNSSSRPSNDVRQRSQSPSISTIQDAKLSQPTVGEPGGAVKRQLPSIPVERVDLSNILPPRKAPLPPTAQIPYSPAPAIQSDGDPVRQLSQMNLERRSSKRFSENYLAQLTSSPTSDRHKLSVDGVRKNLQKSISIPEAIEDEAHEEPDYSASRAYQAATNASPKRPTGRAAPQSVPPPSMIFQSAASPTIETRLGADIRSREDDLPEPDPDIIFVQLDARMRKLPIELPTTIVKLKVAISDLLELDTVSTLHIEDPVSRVSYELEDDTDVRSRSLVKVIQPEAKTEGRGNKTLEGSTDLQSWIAEKFNVLSKEISDLKSTPHFNQPRAVSEATPARNLLSDEKPMSKSENAVPEHEVEQDRLKEMLSRAEKTNKELTETIQQLEAALSDKEAIVTPAVLSAEREAVMSMSAKHEHLGTELTAKLEEAMNTMERIRKDVLQRKVTPRPQQLADLSKSFEEVAAEADDLAKSLALLDTKSNKLWEEELTVITTEQEALEYQKMFIDDIKADLEQSLSSLSTIKQVEEQKRLAPTNSVPLIVETTADPTRAIKFVQADIKSLQVNHERRAAAIADAEKQRSKERDYLIENEFKAELGTFVGSNALKSTGGAAEIDRLREEKDEAHRRLLFSPPATPQEHTVDTRSVTDDIAPVADKSEVVVEESDQATAAATKTVSSASILAKIDASKTIEVLGRRKSLVPVGAHPASTDAATAADELRPEDATDLEAASMSKANTPAPLSPQKSRASTQSQESPAKVIDE